MTDTPAGTEFAVDLGLVLAVDCSSSIDGAEFRLEMEGIAAALRHPALRSVIAAGARTRIAVALVFWSDAKSQSVALPWRMLAGAGDLETAAAEIAALDRSVPAGGTGLAAAMDFATALHATLPWAAERHATDVSGDGRDSDGGNPSLARDRAVARGIVVNGLPIVQGSPSIERYYRERVIGGPGAFIEPAEDIHAFRETILRKLLREIGQPVM